MTGMQNRHLLLGVGIGCGALFLLTVLCAGGGYYLVRSTVSVATEASTTIDQLFQSIADGTFSHNYEKATTPEFRRATSPAAYKQLGEQIQTQLGALSSKQMAKLNVRRINTNSFVDVIYQGTFVKGKGTIRATLKRDGDRWLIHGFNIESPALLKEIPTETCPKCGGSHATSARFCPHCGVPLQTESEKQR